MHRSQTQGGWGCKRGWSSYSPAAAAAAAQPSRLPGALHDVQRARPTPVGRLRARPDVGEPGGRLALHAPRLEQRAGRARGEERPALVPCRRGGRGMERAGGEGSERACGRCDKQPITRTDPSPLKGCLPSSTPPIFLQSSPPPSPFSAPPHPHPRAPPPATATAPASSAFQAEVASGSTCTLLPLRAGPATNQR